MVGGSMKHVRQALFQGPLLALGGGRKMGLLAWDRNATDLQELADLVLVGKIKPPIDKTYPLSETPDALRRLGEGRAKGKLVIVM